MYSCCGAGNIVHYRGDSAAQHWNRKLNLTDLCIKHIVEYSVTFITVKERVCINLNALKRSELFFPSSFVYGWEYMCITIKLLCFWQHYRITYEDLHNIISLLYLAWAKFRLFKISFTLRAAILCLSVM